MVRSCCCRRRVCNDEFGKVIFSNGTIAGWAVRTFIEMSVCAFFGRLKRNPPKQQQQQQQQQQQGNSTLRWVKITAHRVSRMTNGPNGSWRIFSNDEDSVEGRTFTEDAITSAHIDGRRQRLSASIAMNWIRHSILRCLSRWRTSRVSTNHNTWWHFRVDLGSYE